MQSLLAVGTTDSQYGTGQVYVFGQRRVCVTFSLQRRASVQVIHFCGEKLIVLDNKNDITILSLDTRKRIATYSPPGLVAALLTDPSLDYCLTGLQNGTADFDYLGANITDRRQAKLSLTTLIENT